MKIFAGLLAAALVAAPALTLAQNSQTIADRKVHQQQRIANGVRSGQLTARETAHLERQEHAINREQRAMRAQNNGRLTAQDRRTLNRQQNRESGRIYAKKHNARVR